MQNVVDRSQLAVDQRQFTNQANSVAVVGVVNAMDCAQGLNRLPWPTMPTVNSDASNISGQPVADHDIFLVPGNQFSESHAEGVSLIFNHLIMSPIVCRGSHLRTR